MVMDLYNDNPAAALTRLRHVSGTTFRRVRDNDTLAEEVRFEARPDGRVTRLWWHSNYLTRR